MSNIKIDIEKREKIEKFFTLLKSSKHNLISSNTKETFEIKHIEDILIPLSKINVGEKNIDIGTGGGIPGVILSIFFDESNWILLDSIYKKVNEISTFVSQLNLNNVSLVYERVENYAKNNLEVFDSVFFRAVARTDICLEYAYPLLKEKGKIYIYKGPSFLSEKKYWENACNILGVKFIKSIEYNLSDNSNRNLLIFEKQRQSKINLPRKNGIAKKRPVGEL